MKKYDVNKLVLLCVNIHHKCRHNVTEAILSNKFAFHDGDIAALNKY